MEKTHGQTSRKLYGTIFLFCTFLTIGFAGLLLPAEARSIYAPWNPDQSGFESLVYGSSSTVDVHRVMGPPDEIIHSQQMFPVVENHYYYEEGGSGAASVLVFQNGLLVGLHYKSPQNQLIDLTYFLTNNGDRQVNSFLNAGYPYYYPYFPFYTAR